MCSLFIFFLCFVVLADEIMFPVIKMSHKDLGYQYIMTDDAWIWKQVINTKDEDLQVYIILSQPPMTGW